ncbi:MAG: hypothetical protein QM610_00090 [Chitinophagaceae bacterium]
MTKQKVKINDTSLRSVIDIVAYRETKVHHKVDLVPKHNHLSDRFLNLIN